MHFATSEVHSKVKPRFSLERPRRHKADFSLTCLLADNTQPAAMRSKSFSPDNPDKPLSQALSDARAEAATEAAPMSPGASRALAFMSGRQNETQTPQRP